MKMHLLVREIGRIRQKMNENILRHKPGAKSIAYILFWVHFFSVAENVDFISIEIESVPLGIFLDLQFRSYFFRAMKNPNK